MADKQSIEILEAIRKRLAAERVEAYEKYKTACTKLEGVEEAIAALGGTTERSLPPPAAAPHQAPRAKYRALPDIIIATLRAVPDGLGSSALADRICEQMPLLKRNSVLTTAARLRQRKFLTEKDGVYTLTKPRQDPS